jgi:hypothetical protein
MQPKISLNIVIEAGPPDTVPRAYCKPSLEEKVRDLLLHIDTGGHDAHVEWEYIKKLYRKLQEVKQTPKVKNLRDMIEPVLAKYGHHKVV